MNCYFVNNFCKKYFSNLGLKMISNTPNRVSTNVKLENRIFGSFVQQYFDYELFKKGFLSENRLKSSKNYFSSLKSNIEWYFEKITINENFKLKIESINNILKEFDENDNCELFLNRMNSLNKLSIADIYLIVRNRLSRGLITFDLHEINAYKSDIENIKKSINFIMKNIEYNNSSKFYVEYGVGSVSKTGNFSVGGNIDLIIDDTLYEIKCSIDPSCKVGYLKQIYMYSLILEDMNKKNNRKWKNKIEMPNINKLCIINPITENVYKFENNIPDSVRDKWETFKIK